MLGGGRLTSHNRLRCCHVSSVVNSRPRIIPCCMRGSVIFDLSQMEG